MTKKIRAFSIVIILLIISIIVAVGIGSVKVPINELITGIINRQGGNIGVVKDIRLPRIVMALLVGANLSVSGVLLQAVMGNPLADPGITGISSGASIAVMFLMLYMPGAVTTIPFWGFIGGVVACFLIYSLAWKDGISAMRIILAGVAVNAMLGGMTSMMSILNSEKLSGVLNWLNGSLSGKSWSDIRIMCVYTIVGLILAFLMFNACNVLELGDKTAKSLGVNPNVQRIIISMVAVFLAGISTAFAGVIGFLGLVVPHISRIMVGSDHKTLIPFSALLGSLVLLLADTFGRNIASPYEIPVGVVMAVLGGPFFLYQLRKGGKSYGG